MRDKLNKIGFVLLDLVMCAFALWLAIYIKNDGTFPYLYHDQFPFYCLIGCPSVLIFGVLLGSYSGIWKYTSISDAFHQFSVSFLTGCVFGIFKVANVNFAGKHGIQGSIVVIFAGIFFLLSTLLRTMPRLIGWLEVASTRRKGNMKRVVIVGAGAAGSMLAKRMLDDPRDGCLPVAFVDDDPEKQHLRIAGVKVIGTTADISSVVKRLQADEIIIAMPSIQRDELLRVHKDCSDTKCPTRFFRSVIDADMYFAGDRSRLQNVSIDDLLFRDSVKTNMRPVYEFLSGKTVMVTGGAGSIGSELCRQVLEHGCAKLVIFDIHENGLFELNEELKLRFDPGRYVLCMGSIRDKKRLTNIMQQYQPDVLIHAAAHKHVPMMEINPCEAVKNNVVGTRNVLECCIENHVRRFVLISTDKAVNPANVMGATKRVAELLVQTMNGRGGCEMAAVRFGNVLGSNGSVIPLFKKQIAAGGPVTVTHQDMTRYFMTIPEAVSLVLSAGVLAKGGELFVLDMGKPVKIYDLATNLIKLSGFEPGLDIEIRITGLRPGEKMYEEIALSGENVDATTHEKIFTVHAQDFNRDAFLSDVEDVITLASSHAENSQIRKRLMELVHRFSENHTPVAAGK